MITRNLAPLTRRYVAVVLIGAGCAGGDGQVERSDAVFQGYMVLDAQAAEFGLAPGDTLMEIQAARAPATLRRQVESDVRGADYELGCTRYFGSELTVVVYVAKSCGPGGRDVHDWGLALFHRENDRFVRDPRVFPHAMRTFCPRSRDKQGRPLTQC